MRVVLIHQAFVAPDEAGVVPAAVREGDADAIGAVNHVIIGDNIAVLGQDDAGTLAAHFLLDPRFELLHLLQRLIPSTLQFACD